MILWEEESLNDREKIFEFLYDFNPDVAVVFKSLCHSYS